jgi:molybdopterin converting factor small subunit
MSNSLPTITVLYFAAASTATGLASEKISIPNEGLKLTELGRVLTSRHSNSDLGKVLNTSRWSVDLEMIDDPEVIVLKGGEEVAVICPVSGG